MKELCSEINNQHIRIVCDNATAVAYINKFGGIKSKECEHVSYMIWKWARLNSNWLSCAHIPGIENTLADCLSRMVHIEASEWKLDPYTFDEIVKTWGLPQIDLFASFSNKQIPRYVSWKPYRNALYIDAFFLDWTNIYGYCFPPFSVIARVLQKIQTDKPQKFIIVAPVWTTQPWFTTIMEMSIDYPRVLPNYKTSLQIQGSDKVHPLYPKIILMACLLSGEPSKVAEFQKQPPTSLCRHGDQALKNNIQYISGDGFYTVVKSRLIQFQYI